eukprot:s5805_g2.t1
MPSSRRRGGASADADAEALVFTVDSQGVCVLKVEGATFLRFAAPIDRDSISEGINITDDEDAMRDVLMKMSVRTLLKMATDEWRIDRNAFPANPKKEPLVEALMTIYPRVKGAWMMADRLARLADTDPDAVPDALVETLAHLARGSGSSETPAPTSTTPTTTTGVFKGQAHKLGADETKDDDPKDVETFHTNVSEDLGRGALIALTKGGCDKVMLNEESEMSKETLGCATVKAIAEQYSVKFFFRYGDQEKAKHLCQALSDYGINCGDGYVFKLYYKAGGSVVQDYEPLFASFGTSPEFFLSVSFLGGAPKKGVQKKQLKREEAKNNAVEAVKSVVGTSVVNLPCVKEVEATIGAFMSKVEENVSEAFKGIFQNHSIEDLVKLLSAMDETSGGSAEQRLRKISPLLVGASAMHVMEGIDQLSKVKLSFEASLIWGFYAGASENPHFNLKSIRDMAQSSLDRKIGFRDGVADAKMDDDI